MWSKKGGVRLNLESGPDGMKVDRGAVVWEVPEGFADPAANVILSITDAGGKETFHTFEVPVYTPQ